MKKEIKKVSFKIKQSKSDKGMIMQNSKFGAVFLSVCFVALLIFAWFRMFPGILDLPLLKYLNAAVVQVQLVISPATPIAGTIYPALVERGDTIVIRLTGENFISGYDYVEKVILVPSGGGDTVYSADTKVKNENKLTAKINTASIPAGVYDVKIVNQFMGWDIVSATYSSLTIADKTETSSGADFAVVHSAVESAIDHTVAETVGISNKDTAQGSFAMALPSNFLSDDSLVLNLRVDSYDSDAYKTGAGASGAKMPEGKGAIGAVYDIKFNTATGGSITTTDKPIDLSFYYNPTSMAQAGISLATLRAYHWGSDTTTWEEVVGSQVSLADNSVSASVSSFSPYTVFGSYICNDGLDNDSDGRTDYPVDLGCSTSSGGSEINTWSDAGGGGTIYHPAVVIGQDPGVKTRAASSATSTKIVKISEIIPPSIQTDIKPIPKLILPTLITKNLRFGMSDVQIKLLQSQLTKAGVYKGPITGYFGGLTSIAVRLYQKKNNISQTGVVGPITMGSLNDITTQNVLSPQSSSPSVSKIKVQPIDVPARPTPVNNERAVDTVRSGFVKQIIFHWNNFWNNLWGK